jgi:hypothetical protein
VGHLEAEKRAPAEPVSDPSERPRVPLTEERRRQLCAREGAAWERQRQALPHYSPGLEPTGPEHLHEPLRRAARAFVLHDRRQALGRRVLCAQARPRRRRGRAPRRHAVRRRTTSGLDPPDEPGEE